LHPLGDGNAATFYRQAADLLPKEKEDVQRYAQWQVDSSQGLIDRCKPAMDAFRRGAWMNSCDWQIDPSKGLNIKSDAPWPDVRPLVYAVALTAHHELINNDSENGTDDAVALMRFARHAQMKTNFICRLLGDGSEHLAIEVLSYHLGNMARRSVSHLKQEIERLPAPQSLTETLAVEKRLVQAKFAEAEASTNGSVALGLMKLNETDVANSFDEAAKILSLPLDQFPSAWQRFKEKLGPGSLSLKLIGALDRVRSEDESIIVHRALLLAAIAVRLDGKQSLAKYLDPASGQPFEYSESNGGFALRSSYAINGQKISLRVEGYP
jgi:hypothetical protein